MKSTALHEDLSREGRVTRSSERSFGITFAIVCAAIGVTGLWTGNPWSLSWLAIGGGFLLLSFAWTAPLKPLNWAWFKLAMLLYAIVNPVALGLLYYLTVTPIGWLMRALGKDLLNLRADPSTPSYWIVRNPPGPPPESMKRQF
jgi:hypothetical protein